ncbi:formate dehydrogenase accessory sulfurtransferase FdhD [Castellaniella denitrificans]|uniref:Sulfur carrier protein FdhD n=1 Tax=Castellaniella denitrificans TaxID=56119 RepID=A0ABT4M0W0_9BURK|nr:formate dehydrogenase accessory sulfurtransferase FdhD [Castellaniella denitrificans]MCZ4328953.1 formate dehydrogenase accessory sulfurtransferase FdhD [Castellaniella denitrificans]
MHPADFDPLSDFPDPSAGLAMGDIVRVGDRRATATQDAIACEQAVALEYNGIAHAALLASPLHIPELALGFSYTEGIIRSPADVLDLEVESVSDGLVVRLSIVNARLHALKLRRRSLAGSTSCGLCGVQSLAQIRRDLPPLDAPEHPWSARAIQSALEQLRQRQPLHNLTGATHAAAWADAEGRLAWTYEDVGRHNALDKLIGRLLREPVDRGRGFVVISSRASFEMVQKAHAAGIRALIAVSAPTTLAVRLAQEAPMMLAGFARDGRCTIYSRPDDLNMDLDGSRT